MVIDVYASGEGYLLYLLLRDYLTDIHSDICLRYIDRPLTAGGNISLFLIPQPSEWEIQTLSAVPRKGKTFILSANCGDIPECMELKGEYLIEGLALVLDEILNNPQLAEEIRAINPQIDGELMKTLTEKLTFYIPLAVAKRDTILKGWKYYLGLKGFPLSGYLYPFEERQILSILSNVGFQDKMFPLLLGRTKADFVEEIKRRGFVPVEVLLKAKNNLESELNYILLAKSVAERLQKL